MGTPVKLHVYDLSQGMAAQVSPMLLGKQIGGIWHTGVEVYGREFYYGGGIQSDPPGQTPYGRPVEVIEMGLTHVPEEVCIEYLQELAQRFTPEAYSLLGNNCNNFSDEVTHFLTGQGIPGHITGLPSEVLSSPMGAMLQPLLQGMEAQMRAAHGGQGPTIFPKPPAPTPAAAPAPAPAPAPAASAAAAPSPAAAAAAAAERRAAAPPPAPASPADPEAAKAAFQAAVAAEFQKVMAGGGRTANEAAAEAMRTVTARMQGGGS